jgi:osmotically-inducible protein OsmY
MKFQKRSQSSEIVLALALSLSWVAPGRAQSATSQAQPDNTKVNKRDRNPDEATADQQKMNLSDRNLTARIRKSVIGDKTLSSYAHNVKIISQNGIVTLKGPVRSDGEVRSMMTKAVEVAGGSDKVVNQMSVKR